MPYYEKTVFVWHNMGDATIEFFDIDGDYSEFNGIYLGLANQDEYKQNELSAIYENHKEFYSMCDQMNLPTLDYSRIHIIHCGTAE